MEFLLYIGNLLALALLWFIVVLAYRTFWRSLAAGPSEGPLFADLDPDEQFWLVPTAGAANVSPSDGIPLGQGALLGRGEACHMRIEDPFVSDEHLRVSSSRWACLVEDLDSANGYLVEGRPTRGESVLKEGQWFSVGEVTIRIERRPN